MWPVDHHLILLALLMLSNVRLPISWLAEKTPFFQKISSNLRWLLALSPDECDIFWQVFVLWCYCIAFQLKLYKFLLCRHGVSCLRLNNPVSTNQPVSLITHYFEGSQRLSTSQEFSEKSVTFAWCVLHNWDCMLWLLCACCCVQTADLQLPRTAVCWCWCDGNWACRLWGSGTTGTCHWWLIDVSFFSASAVYFLHYHC